MRLTLTTILLAFTLFSFGQQLSTETRKRFVADQDRYLEGLSLSIDQRKAYQTITIKYEKVFMNIYRNNASSSMKKRQVKQFQKKKNKEMATILSRVQFKQYVNRQKEIAKNYNE